MKLLTLNLHCYAEIEIIRNQSLISQLLIDEGIDVIFFQEVAQSETAKIVVDNIKEDNYAYIIQQLLKDEGYDYDLHYMYGNLAFGVYQEGLAILSKSKLENKRHFFISNKVDYYDWHTRVIVSCETSINNQKITLTSAHLGWTEGDEVFEDQVDKLISNIVPKGISILAGDLNVASGSRSYDYVIGKGYYDLFYNDDEEFFFTPTHISDLDVQVGSNRIDYILSNTQFKLTSRKIVFKEPLVSDHMGVLIDVDMEE